MFSLGESEGFVSDILEVCVGVARVKGIRRKEVVRRRERRKRVVNMI
jgi:hypothetical protein